MPNKLFTILTFVSLVNFGFASMLMKALVEEQEMGMVMIYFIPLLILGLGFGVAATMMKIKQQLKLNLLLNWMHHFNLLLMVFGVLALVSALLN